MILQLNPAIPLRHIEKGNFLAHFIHDEGIESHIMFTGILEESGEIWTFVNTELRACKNLTIGRNPKPTGSRCIHCDCPWEPICASCGKNKDK